MYMEHVGITLEVPKITFLKIAPKIFSFKL